MTYQEVYLMDNLTIEAKAIYGMLCSYAGAGAEAYPSVDFMCEKLMISRRRFYTHMNLLIGSGVVKKQMKRENGQRTNNIYILTPNIQNLPVDNVTVGFETVENLTVHNGTNNNNTRNNNIINNNRASSIVCSEPEKSDSPPASGIQLPLNDKTFYDVPVDKISMWEKTYPAVNVRQELQKMIAWLDANPERKKTRRGIAAFINRWLSKEQDNGGYHYQRKEEKTSSALPYANEPDPVYHWPKAAVDFCADDADEQFERYMQQKEERKWRERMMQDTSQHAE